MLVHAAEARRDAERRARALAAGEALRGREAAEHAEWRGRVAAAARVRPEASSCRGDPGELLGGGLRGNGLLSDGGLGDAELPQPRCVGAAALSCAFRERRSDIWRGLAGSSSATTPRPWQEHAQQLWRSVEVAHTAAGASALDAAPVFGRSAPPLRGAQAPAPKAPASAGAFAAAVPPPILPPPFAAALGGPSATDRSGTECFGRGAAATDEEADPRLAEEHAWCGVVAWNREALKGERLKREAEEARLRKAEEREAQQARHAAAGRRLAALENGRGESRGAGGLGDKALQEHAAWLRQPAGQRAEQRELGVREKLEDYRAAVFSR